MVKFVISGCDASESDEEEEPLGSRVPGRGYQGLLLRQLMVRPCATWDSPHSSLARSQEFTCGCVLHAGHFALQDEADHSAFRRCEVCFFEPVQVAWEGMDQVLALWHHLTLSGLST